MRTKISQILILVLLSLIVLFGCEERKGSNGLDLQVEKDTLSHPTRINSEHLNYITLFRDGISSYSKPKIELLILDSLLNHEYYTKYISLPDANSEKSIEVVNLDRDRFLVMIVYHNPFGPFGHYGEVSIINTSRNEISLRKQIPGSKYHPPDIFWLDIDEDDENEILSRLVFPTSSVAVIDYYDTFYEFSKDESELIEVFKIATKSVDCASRYIDRERFPDTLGQQILRDYAFENPLFLQVKNRYYSFDCNEYLDSIKNSLVFLKEEMSYFERVNEKEVFIEK